MLFASPLQLAYSDSNKNMISKHLAEYANLYPDINFRHVESSSVFEKSNLYNLLSNMTTTNMDYEHNISDAENLRNIQLTRVQLMLNKGMPSATFYKVDKVRNINKPYLCLITLDPSVFTKKASSATEFMTNRDGRTKPFIDNNATLEFILEHEVFHCLNAYENGYIYAKTNSRETADYQNHISESQADTYAALIFRNKYNNTDFIRKMLLIRIYNLTDFDVMHYSVPTLLSVLELTNNEIKSLSHKHIFNLALKKTQHTSLSFETYQNMRAGIFQSLSKSSLLTGLQINDAPELEFTPVSNKEISKWIYNIKNSIRFISNED